MDPTGRGAAGDEIRCRRIGGRRMDEHPNSARIREALDAYARRDFADMREYLAEDIVWHVAGNHRFSGDYRGRKAVLEYFKQAQEVTGGTLSLEVDEVLADDHFGAVALKAVGQRGDRRLSVTLAEAFRFDDQGRWAEFWAVADDQAAVDDFWGV